MPKPLVIKLPLGRSTFVPAGCLHWPIGDKDLLKEWIKEVKSAENGFTVLMGDSLDAARTHYRNHLKVYKDDENSQLQLDEWHRKDVEELAKLLDPIKDRVRGVVLGNHYWVYGSGINSEQYLAHLLGVPYLGPLGLARLDFVDPGGRTRHHATLYAHHSGGSTGGRTTGGDVGALERTELSFDADIYVLSHTHRRHAFRIPTMSLTSKGDPRIREKTKVFIRSGAFLKGYKEEEATTTKPHFPSYAEAKALRPTDLGWVKLHIDCRARGNTTGGSDYGLEYRIEY